MPNNFPDTLPNWEDTRAADAEAGNIFSSDVRVQLHWSDIEEAVERGAIVPSEAHALWAMWASPGSAQRVVGNALTSEPEPHTQHKPGFLNSLF